MGEPVNRKFCNTKGPSQSIGAGVWKMLRWQHPCGCCGSPSILLCPISIPVFFDITTEFW